MTLTESIVEDAALTWFGSWATPALGQKPSPRPSATGRGSLAAKWCNLALLEPSSQPSPTGRRRRARPCGSCTPPSPNPRTLPALSDTLSPKLLGGELAVGAALIGSILSGESRAPLQGHTAKTNAVDSSKISATK